MRNNFLCARHDLELGGHTEKVHLQNCGNFLEILQLLACHDLSIRQKLDGCPCNATYTSPEMQNALLQTMSDVVRTRICNEVQKVCHFSILVDETKILARKNN